VRIPRANDPRDAKFAIAADDASHFQELAGPALEDAVDVQWYEQHGTEVDRAAFILCRLRRAMASQGGAPEYGDGAVREVLDHVSPEALLWMASRAISYMDEHGYPEAVAPWFPEVTASPPA
jgi:hypothetical protein